MLFLIIVILLSVEYGYKITQGNDLKKGVDTIFLAYERHSIIADVNYYA